MFLIIDAIKKVVKTLENEEASITSDLLKRRIYEIVNAEEISAEKERREIEAKEEEERNRISFNNFVANYIEECATGVRKKENSTMNVAPSTVKSYRGFFCSTKSLPREQRCCH